MAKEYFYFDVGGGYDTRYCSKMDEDNPKIDYFALKELCYCIRSDTKEKIMMGNIYDICENTSIKYNGKSISYLTLINNYELINFQYLISTCDNITKTFVDSFCLVDYFPEALSARLRFGIHDDIIEEYKSHRNLNWNLILRNNPDISSEDIRKYYKYFRSEEFISNRSRKFTKEDLAFILEEETQNFRKYLIDGTEYVKALFVTHEFLEDDLIYVIKHLKKLRKEKVFNDDKEKDNFDFALYKYRQYILEYGKYSENLLLKTKTFFKKEEKLHASAFAHYSEDFIRNNENLINWRLLSINKVLLNGTYSDDFYETYKNKIEWNNFDSETLMKFCKTNIKRFKEFFLKFYKYMDGKDVRRILSPTGYDTTYNSNYPFTVDELLKHFSIILKDTHKKPENEIYAIAMIKAGNEDFTVVDIINSDITKYGIEFVKTFKKEIFDAMLNDEICLGEKERIDNLLEEINTKKGDKQNGHE